MDIVCELIKYDIPFFVWSLTEFVDGYNNSVFIIVLAWALEM